MEDHGRHAEEEALRKQPGAYNSFGVVLVLDAVYYSRRSAFLRILALRGAPTTVLAILLCLPLSGLLFYALRADRDVL